MSANLNTPVIETPIEENGGIVWNRLHSEREDICEALINGELQPLSATHSGGLEVSKQDAIKAANWHRELLQSRLRKVDDALDRLTSGSYGDCCKCNRWIEDTMLEFDPAIAFCRSCWERELQASAAAPVAAKSEVNPPASSWPDGLALATLAQFDMVHVRTLNSEYRIFLLDPSSGRALVVGGILFAEPVEALVSGSKSWDSSIKSGELCVGLRIEMWVNDRLISTSPIKSVCVEHYVAEEPSPPVMQKLVM